MIQVWEPNLFNCPLNKRVHFLVNYNGKTYECIGTLTTNMYTGGVIRGECLDGMEKVFYNGELVGWKFYMTDAEFEAFSNAVSFNGPLMIVGDAEYTISGEDNDERRHA